jgi:hypothetical protein
MSRIGGTTVAPDLPPAPPPAVSLCFPWELILQEVATDRHLDIPAAIRPTSRHGIVSARLGLVSGRQGCRWLL